MSAAAKPMSHPIHEDTARESVVSGYSALEADDFEAISDGDDDNGPLGLQCLPHLSRRVPDFCLFEMLSKAAAVLLLAGCLRS